MTVRVLALDIATTTGVCYDGMDWIDVPKFETWELRSAGGVGQYGARFASLARRLDSLIAALAMAKCKPDIIAFEEPLNVKRRSSKMSNGVTRLLVGLASVAECVAYQHGIKCVEVPVSTAKAHFGGRTKDADPKAAVMARCRVLGWQVKNTDEGDSAAIWSFVKCTSDPKFSYQTTPLFGRRA